MKNYIKLSIFAVLALVVASSCEDEDAVRVPDLQTGATLRIQFTDPAFSIINLEDRSTARLEFDVFTVNNDIDSANLYMNYYNSEQDSLYPTVLYRSWSQADFDNEGAIRNVQVTLQDIADTYNISSDIINGGDEVSIATEVILEDGRRYPNEVELPNGQTYTNSPDVRATGVSSSFTLGFTSPIICPVPAGFAEGRYRLEQTGGDPVPWSSMEVTIRSTGLIDRSFTASYYGFEQDINFTLFCGNVVVPTTGTGLSCAGGPELVFEGASPGSPYSTDSDEVIEIQLVENLNGSCGFPTASDVTLTLTKIE